MNMNRIQVQVNGQAISAVIDPRVSLGDFLRDELNLTGLHLACEHGVCGACTVLVDDQPIRACITLAAAMDGKHVRTIEGLDDDPVADVVREAFRERHGLQCGFCTPGMVITVRDMLQRGCCQSKQEIRQQLAGNLCRCTGYGGIVEATVQARDRLSASRDMQEQNDVAGAQK